MGIRARIGVLWTFTSLGACSGDPGLQRVSPNGFFDPPALILTETQVGQVQRTTVVFSNAAGGVLEIVDLRLEPSLDVFEVRPADRGSAIGRRLAPNAHLDLEILFGPDREASYETTLWLTSRDLEIGLPISARGTILGPPVLSGPARVAFTGPAIAGQTLIQTIEIRNTGERETWFTRARADPPFSVSMTGGGAVTDAGFLAPQDRVNLEIRFHPLIPGVFDGMVLFEAERTTPLTIDVSGTAEEGGTLTCSPEELDLGPVIRGNTRFKTVQCQTHGGSVPVTEVAWSSPASASPEGPFLLRNVIPPPPITVTESLSFEVGFEARGLPALSTGTVDVQLGTNVIQPIRVHGETIAPPPDEVDLSITASWTANADIDLHLVEDGAEPYSFGRDCHWGTKTLDWNQPEDSSDDPFLDRDATKGPGEETINLARAAGGIYEIWVQYFGPSTGNSMEVTVDVRLQGEAPVSLVRTLTECGTSWQIGRVRFDVQPSRFQAIDVETNAYASFTFECGN